jgi:hypothetical protein
MGWASLHIEKLRRGETVSFRPVGNSMTPRIRSRQLVTVAPVETADVALGDVVLCNVNGNQMLHLVTAIDVTRERFQISNNHGHVNGWTAARQIHGKVIALDT